LGPNLVLVIRRIIMEEKMLNMAQELKESARVEAAFGKPETIGEKTIIPIAQVSYALGMGFGEGEVPAEAEGEEAGTGRGDKRSRAGVWGSEDVGAKARDRLSGGGGGGRASTRPLGVLEVTTEETKLIPIVDIGRLTMAGVVTGALFILFVIRPLIKLFGQEEAA
jgi:uncharacterized spore protein YtfJ